MDERRMAVLKEKAATAGLSEQEASELGRLYAQAEHKPYSDAATERRKRTERDRMERERRAARRLRGPFGRLAGTHRVEIGAVDVPADEAEVEQFGPRSDREQGKAA